MHLAWFRRSWPASQKLGQPSDQPWQADTQLASIWPAFPSRGQPRLVPTLAKHANLHCVLPFGQPWPAAASLVSCRPWPATADTQTDIIITCFILLDGNVQDMFNDPEVLKTLQTLVTVRGHWSAVGGSPGECTAVRYNEVACVATSMAFFDRLYECGVLLPHSLSLTTTTTTHYHTSHPPPTITNRHQPHATHRQLPSPSPPTTQRHCRRHRHRPSSATATAVIAISAAPMPTPAVYHR
jgi:hypothetical protein